MNAKDLLNNYANQNVSSNDVKTAEKKSKNLGSCISDFKLLLKMFKDGMSGKYSVSGTTLATIGAAIAYVAFPFDAIPDFLIPFGYTDDIAVVSLVIKQLSNEIQKYKKSMNL